MSADFEYVLVYSIIACGILSLLLRIIPTRYSRKYPKDPVFGATEHMWSVSFLIFFFLTLGINYREINSLTGYYKDTQNGGFGGLIILFISPAVTSILVMLYVLTLQVMVVSGLSTMNERIKGKSISNTLKMSFTSGISLLVPLIFLIFISFIVENLFQEVADDFTPVTVLLAMSIPFIITSYAQNKLIERLRGSPDDAI